MGILPLMGAGKTAAGGGWWLAGGIPAANCLAAYQAKGAVSYAASLVNLANPGTYNLVCSSGDMSWATGTGFVGDGAKYFTTGITGADATWSMIIRFADCSGAPEYVGGSANRTNNARRYIWPRNNSSDSHVYGLGTAVTVTTRLVTAVLAYCGLQGYLNGVADGGAGTWGSGTAPETYMMANNDNGSVIGKMVAGSKWYAAAVYNINVAAYIVALTAAINAL